MSEANKIRNLSGAVMLKRTAKLLMLCILLLSIGISLIKTPVYGSVAPFGQSSFWNSPISTYTELHPATNLISANISSQASGAGISYSEGSTYYEADAETSLSSVAPYDCGNGLDSSLTGLWSSVPIPVYSVSGGGSKQRMVIYQASSGIIWEFEGMQNTGGQWQACRGGQINIHSNGVFPNPYGVTTGGLSVMGGQISTDEIRSGNIHHAVGLSLPSTNGMTWPATRSGGVSANAPALGQRLRVDPSLDIDALNLSPVAKAIVKASQQYGIVVWNNGQAGFMAESPNSKTSRNLPNPYSGIDLSLANFPWDKLQVLPDNYGQVSGTPAISEFKVSQNSITSGARVSLSWKSNNISKCVINGIGDNLVANGSIQSKPLHSTTIFTLRCGGPLGTASAQLQVSVTLQANNDKTAQLPGGVLLDQPFSGYANIFPDLINLEGVYKVIYYLDNNYLSETTSSPFALNTLRLKNGKYSVFAKAYSSDGQISEHRAEIAVDNKPEVLGLMTQSSPIEVPVKLPRLWAVTGGITVALIMTFGTYWGLRRINRTQ